jgi:hypothetical protein
LLEVAPASPHGLIKMTGSVTGHEGVLPGVIV